MGQITIRIPDDLEEKIDERRGEKTRSDFYREVLAGYLTTDYKLTTSPGRTDDNLIANAISMQDEIKYLKAKLDEALNLLHQEQVLHLQTQRMLPAPAPEKKWWEFWK